MPNRTRRATRTRVAARNRAAYLAERIGRGLREARLRAGLLQREVAQASGISQSFYSRIERGHATNASLETLAVCALACGTQLAAFLEALPGASVPRDIEHLRRQQALIALAARGGWRATPERPIDPDAGRSRSIDVYLEREATGEVIVAEIVTFVMDLGAVMRGLEDKVAAIRRECADRESADRGNADRPRANRPRADREEPGQWRVRGLLIVRATRRNRVLIGDLSHLLAARYPARSAAWLTALGHANRPMPDDDGFLWTSVASPDLRAARLSRQRAPS